MGAKVGNYYEAPSKLFVQGLYDQSATKKQRMGTIRTLDDGRVFAYARAGATMLPGKITMGPAPAGNHNTIAVGTAAAVNDKVINVTLGATAVAANLYQDGFIIINDASAGGEFYKIRGHSAIALSTSGDIDLYDSVRVALTTSNTCTLVKNIQNGVALGLSSLTAMPAGVPLIDVTDNYYFWNQVKGPCSVLTAGTLVLGEACIVVDTGAVGPTGANDTETRVGTVLSVSATTLYSIINLAIPGY